MTPPVSPRSSSQDSGSSGADFAAFLEAQLDVDEFEEAPEFDHETEIGNAGGEEKDLDIPPEVDVIEILNPEPELPVSCTVRYGTVNNPEAQTSSLREADTGVSESWEGTRGDSGGGGEDGVSLGGQKRKWTWRIRPSIPATAHRLVAELHKFSAPRSTSPNFSWIHLYLKIGK